MSLLELASAENKTKQNKQTNKQKTVNGNTQRLLVQNPKQVNKSHSAYICATMRQQNQLFTALKGPQPPSQTCTSPGLLGTRPHSRR